MMTEAVEAITAAAADRHKSTSYVDWVPFAACTGKSWLFEATASIDDARRVCRRCPVLHQCRPWALHNAVFGVAGGMTAEERTAWRAHHDVPEPDLTLDQFLDLDVAYEVDDNDGPSTRSGAVLEAVNALTERGLTSRQIGSRIGHSRRHVFRLRAQQRALDSEVSASA